MHIKTIPAPELDNTAWQEGVKRGRAKLAKGGTKVFVMLDKTKTPEENYEILTKAIKENK